MNILREGPKHLIIHSDMCDKTFESLKNIFKYHIAIKKSEKIYDEYLGIIGLLDDCYTVLMFTNKMAPKLSFAYDDIEYIVVVNDDIENILIKLVENKESIKIKKIRKSPEMIVMRTTGDESKYINSVLKDVEGTLIPACDMFEKYGKGTMVIFTDKPISGPIDLKDFSDRAIYSEMRHKDVMKYLNTHRVKYVNASINNKDWSELVIKIYDSHEQYDLHYKRISLVLNALDCGLILGESWGKDAALAFLSVGVYQIRLFTYLEPSEIKKIVLGLEYTSEGKRVVDYDLFTKRKKHYWTDVRVDKIKRRDELGSHYRAMLEKRLSEDVVVELLKLEHPLK